MVQIGDRYQFDPARHWQLPAQEVAVTSISDDDQFFCRFHKFDGSDEEFMCRGLDVPGYGTLLPMSSSPAKQHDQISLEEWREKARSPNWPRGS